MPYFQRLWNQKVKPKNDDPTVANLDNTFLITWLVILFLDFSSHLVVRTSYKLAGRI